MSERNLKAQTGRDRLTQGVAIFGGVALGYVFRPIRAFGQTAMRTLICSVPGGSSIHLFSTKQSRPFFRPCFLFVNIWSVVPRIDR